MLRVVLGRARPETEWSGKISGLQFNSIPGVQASMRSGGVTSMILTVQRSHHGEQVNLEVNGDLEARSEPSEPLDLAEGMGETKEEKARI